MQVVEVSCGDYQSLNSAHNTIKKLFLQHELQQLLTVYVSPVSPHCPSVWHGAIMIRMSDSDQEVAGLAPSRSTSHDDRGN